MNTFEAFSLGLTILD